MPLVIVLEGITIQHAAELLYDTASTRASRAKCRYSYLRALEDFTWAMLASDALATSKYLPSVGGSSPGQDLLKQFQKDEGKQILWLETGSKADKPKDLLQEADERLVIRYWIHRLSDAILRERIAWQEHMVREFEVYAGDHESLREELIPKEYVFQGNFPYDFSLETSIPKEYVDLMLQIAPACTVSGKRFHPRAQREFIKRNVLAHITNWHWYQVKRVMPQLGVSARNTLSHVTRASLYDAQKFDERRAGWRLIIPRLLGPIMKICNNRDELRNALIDLSGGNLRAKAFRAKLVVAFDLYSKGKYQQLEALRNEVEEWGRSSPAQEGLGIKAIIGIEGALAPIPVKPYGKLEMPIRLGEKCYGRYDRSTRLLVRSATRDEEYEAQAERLFPELRNHSARSI